MHPTAFRDDPLRILRGVARCSIDGLEPDAATLAAHGRGRAAHRRALGRARARGARADVRRRRRGVDALRLARDVGALAVALPEWAPCIGVDQESATQAYTLDEHILHVLEAAVHDGAGAGAAARRVLARRGQAARPGAREHAEAGARITRRALRRLTYDNDTVAVVTTLVREHSYDEDREPTALAARVFLARVGRERARDLLALRRWDRIGRGVPIPAARIAARASASRRSSSRSGRSPWRSPTSRCAATTSSPPVSPRARRSARRCARLLEAVVDDPSLNERETLLRLACARSRSTSIAACSSAWI